MELIQKSLEFQLVFLLYFLRATGFLVVLPLFSARAVPVLYQVALAFFLALILAPLYQGPAPTELLASPAMLINAAAGEVVLGLMVGFLVGVIFVIFDFAGSLIGYQMGFGIINVLNPTQGQQTGLVGEFFFTLASLLFLVLNLHHLFLIFWQRSFELVSVGSFTPVNMGLAELVRVAGDFFLISVQLAMPLLAVLILTDVVLGIMARTMPTLNVFIVGLPLKVGLGLFFLGITIAALGPLSGKIALTILEDGARLVRTLAGA